MSGFAVDVDGNEAKNMMENMLELLKRRLNRKRDTIDSLTNVVSQQQPTMDTFTKVVNPQQSRIDVLIKKCERLDRFSKILLGQMGMDMQSMRSKGY